MHERKEGFIQKRPFLSLLGEGLALVGFVLLLIGMTGTARLFREEYVGPVPAVMKGFVPMTVGSPAGGSAPPVASRPRTSTRPSLTVVSPARREKHLSQPTPAAEQSLPAENSLSAENPLPAAASLPRIYLPSIMAPPASWPSAPVEAQGQEAGGAIPPTGDVQAMVQPAQPALPALPDWIQIPKIGLEAPVVEVPTVDVRIDGESLQQWSAPNNFAAGWHAGSAQLGQPGNTVFNGHHNIHGSVFGRLRDLQPGDQIFVWSHDQAYFYEVEQILLLEERYAQLSDRHENARWILPSDDERLTLVTCWPPESNTHRLIVVARPIQK